MGILSKLKKRFENNMSRHKGLDWRRIQDKLENFPDKIRSLTLMEETGGEPDIIGYDKKTGEYLFCDCSPESPSERRNLCYDRVAQESRKVGKPQSNVLDESLEMGVELLTESQYRDLQKLGNFDTKTSSWLKTPIEIRVLGGALFGDRRYNQVFIYHNGASSYYASRGFRGLLRI